VTFPSDEEDVQLRPMAKMEATAPNKQHNATRVAPPDATTGERSFIGAQRNLLAIRLLSCVSMARGREAFALTSSKHLIEILNVLDLSVGVAVSIAPPPPRSDWQVLQRASEHARAILDWESRSGQWPARATHNGDSMDEVASTRRSKVATFRGFSDLYVPILIEAECVATLVAGPFLTEPPSAEQIIESWAGLRGRAAERFDRELADYARAMIHTPVLGAKPLAAFRELLEILARALAGRPELPRDARRVVHLRNKVFSRMPGARQYKGAVMLDPVSNSYFLEGKLTDWEVNELRIRHMPNAVVAVMPKRTQTRAHDVVSTLVEAHTFQRHAADLSSHLGEALAAPLEDYGAYFLCYVPPRRNPSRQRLALVERAREIAERLERALGIQVTVGVGGLVTHASELPRCGRDAVVALQLATERQSPLLVYDEALADRTRQSPDRVPASLLLQLIDLLATGRLDELEVRRGDYVRAVLWDTGGRINEIRSQLAYALDALLARTLAQQPLDAKTHRDLRERFRESLDRAASSGLLTEAFDDATNVLARMAESPTEGRLELKLARAVRFIEDHHAQSITLGGVARHSGLSKTYFSERFKEWYGTGFNDYVRRTRVERAKHILRSSSLPIQTISQECGFGSVSHFNRAFRAIVGTTPSDYRESQRLLDPNIGKSQTENLPS
jgi:AraC-like DNA-binding protein